jgi:hypothetical protein
MQRTEGSEAHEKFKELCALAQANELTVGEQLDLECHLRTCRQCRELYRTYSMIGTEGMPFLAKKEDVPLSAQQWDNTAAWRRLAASIQEAKNSHKVLPFQTAIKRGPGKTFRWNRVRRELAAGLAAAGVIALVAIGSYRAGVRSKVAFQPELARVAPIGEVQGPSAKPAVRVQDVQTEALEHQISKEQKSLAELRTAASLAEEQVRTLATAKDEKEEELRLRTAERDDLASRLAQEEKTYQTLQIELANLKAEHDRSTLRMASLESKVIELNSVNQDQQRRIRNDEDYLVSDRDIRELMGARKLYIADVFDVDSGSRTRKPFGRVFYTQNKSLVFYAFDLDHQPGVKNASTFQVWGQRDLGSDAESHPTNLGILYMDSESNRRWALRFDDPKQLAEIDAVFVTVEPHGGSQKPTGKPFLYALLRKEANHP